jgi:hypothetical protein
MVWEAVKVDKLNKKAYEAYEKSEPKGVVKIEIKKASKVLGKKATHKDAEKLEPMKTKIKEAKKGEKILSKAGKKK